MYRKESFCSIFFVQQKIQLLFSLLILNEVYEESQFNTHPLKNLNTKEMHNYLLTQSILSRRKIFAL